MPLAALENQERIFPNWVTLLERSLNTFNKSKNPAAVHRLTKITVSAAHIQDVVSYVHCAEHNCSNENENFDGP